MMTARVRKKVRHSSNVTPYMDHLLGWPTNCRYPICRGGCIPRPLNRSMQHVINVGPTMGKTLEMVWRSPGDFLEISWRCSGLLAASPGLDICCTLGYDRHGAARAGGSISAQGVLVARWRVAADLPRRRPSEGRDDDLCLREVRTG